MRYRVIIWSLCVLMVLLGCSAGPTLQPLSVDAVILAFGDSLTAGTGAAQEASYPAVLSRLIGRTVINAGIPGEVTAAGMKRLPEILDREKPALVLLCLGGNDFLQRLDQAGTKENLRNMIGMIRERRIDVVLIGVPRLGLGVDVPNWYAEIAKGADVPFEGKLLRLILADRSLKSDLIHPNATGYQKFAEGLAELLRKSGALPK